MRIRLDTVTNLATLAMCVIMGVVLVQSRFDTRTQSPKTYSPGEKVSGLSEVNFGAAQKTVLLAIRKDCEYCQASVSFYRTLMERVAKSHGSVQLAVISSDPVPTISEFLNPSSTATLVSLTQTRMREMKIIGTPTIVVADPSGLVKQVWLGKLDGAGEQEVLRSIG
jgi:hypothetical protein